MARKYNQQRFTCKIDGQEYRFDAYTTDTRSGFCHTVKSLDYEVTDAKQSYMNRTWETFRYETVLLRIIGKFPKKMQAEMTRQLIDGEAAAETERCEKMFSSFQSLYDGLNEENKKRLKNLPPIQTESDARAVMGFMRLLNLMQ